MVANALQPKRNKRKTDGKGTLTGQIVRLLNSGVVALKPERRCASGPRIDGKHNYPKMPGLDVLGIQKDKYFYDEATEIQQSRQTSTTRCIDGPIRAEASRVSQGDAQSGLARFASGVLASTGGETSDLYAHDHGRRTVEARRKDRRFLRAPNSLRST